MPRGPAREGPRFLEQRGLSRSQATGQTLIEALVGAGRAASRASATPPRLSKVRDSALRRAGGSMAPRPRRAILSGEYHAGRPERAPRPSTGGLFQFPAQPGLRHLWFREPRSAMPATGNHDAFSSPGLLEHVALPAQPHLLWRRGTSSPRSILFSLASISAPASVPQPTERSYFRSSAPRSHVLSPRRSAPGVEAEGAAGPLQAEADGARRTRRRRRP